MFRLLRTLAPSIQPSFRPHPPLLHRNGHMRVQRVRFVRPFFTRRRTKGLLFTAGLVTAFIWFNVDLSFEEEEGKSDSQLTVEKTTTRLVEKAGDKNKKSSHGWAKYTPEGELTNDVRSQEHSRRETENEDEAEDEVNDWKDDGEDDEAEAEDEGNPIIPEDAFSLFIPLGLPIQRQSSYYKGSDPEWQSFLRFARDKERVSGLRNELAGLIGHYTATLPNFQSSLGRQIHTGKYWLDVDFPDGPPPEYEQRGLLFTEDYIALTTKSVPAREYERMKNLLRPTAMATSLWASYKVLWSLQFAKVKDFLNIKLDEKSVKPNPPSSFVDSRRLANHKQDYQTGSTVGDGSESESSKGAPAEETPKTSPGRASSNSTNALPPLPSIPEPGEELNLALQAFTRTLAKTWKGPSTPAERGAILVSGLVQVEGSRAVCVMDVRAFYHPEQSRWIGISMGVRRMQARKQVPRGGR